MNMIKDIITKFSNKKGGINTSKIKMLDNIKYLNTLIELTNFLPEDTHLRFRFNYLKNNYITPKKCKICEKVLIDVNKVFCSSLCSNKDENTVLKIKTTWNNKSSLEIEIIQNSRKSTNLEKYGVDIASKLAVVIEKNKQSHFTNWGGYAMADKEIKDKREKTCIEKYGGVGMASTLIFDKMKEKNIEYYGVEYFSKTTDWYQKCVKTCLDKYGEEWVSKVDEINKKQQSGGYSWYDFEFPSGKVYRVQGYEPIVLTQLLTTYEENDIIVGVQNIIDEIGFFKYSLENKEHRYYPDIYLRSENLVIEVKSVYTFNKEKNKNLLKRAAVLSKNYNFKFIIL